jgi:hypothetical protein
MRTVPLLTALLALTAATPARAQKPGPILAIDPSRFDTTCAPCTDFYRYANGG